MVRERFGYELGWPEGCDGAGGEYSRSDGVASPMAEGYARPARLAQNPALERIVDVCFDTGTEQAYHAARKELQGAGNEQGG
jgi:hypothetical protein